MISHGYKNMRIQELDTFSALVVSRLSNNPIFATLKTEALVSLEPAYLAFSTAMQEAASKRGNDRYELRETCRLKLVDQLYFTSIMVEAFAKGDEEIIKASSFTLLRSNKGKSTKKEALLVTTPLNLKVSNMDGKPGFLYLEWLKVTGSKSYAIEHRLKGETVWKNGDYTTNEFIELSGFASDSIVEFRIRALGVDTDKSDWTGVAKVLVN